MKQFLKFFLASTLGTLVSLFLIVLIVIGMIASMLTFSSKEITKVEDKTILELRFDKPIVDRSPTNPFAGFNWQSMENNEPTGLDDIIKNIVKAGHDEKIAGLFLNLSDIAAQPATLEDIRNELLKFKETGKFIIAYGETLSQKAYYIATVADQIFLQPEGSIDFKGLMAQVMFYKNLLDKVGVEPQVIRHGKFKSAVEPFMLNKMSEANRDQTARFIGTIWDNMIKQMAESRSIEIPRMNQLADSLVAEEGNTALNAGLIDGLSYYDEVLDDLKTKIGVMSDDSLTLLSFEDYFMANDPVKKKSIRSKKIAVIYAVGEIESGDGDDKTIGSDRIAAAIRKARLDDKVRAIVLRVNSPGGSALASDVIWREVKLARGVKPVVASLGDVAASGGYYIACGADTIMAMPNTITGSIGVFGIIPNIGKLVTEKIGVTFDEVATNKNSDYISIMKPLSPYQRDFIQKGVEKVYDTFISHVSEGRGLTKAEVDSIGQGRVWSGIDAKEIGLVDLFGGLDDAVKLAASMANIDEYRVVTLPEQIDPFQKFFGKLGGADTDALITRNFGEYGRHILTLKKLVKADRIQTRMPMEITIN
ncbi:MAG: signal peptide peptidase SppA [Bacteroidetes bacterium GWE2_42_24]|nr:MAG: signal peptide peptidase SppA [Bacteroidetes bacterium GWE2_42_24]OFY30097.1 MAG: signal peptide peptidase SppA [Bacteroidetes bacterium GWF2_43_11]